MPSTIPSTEILAGCNILLVDDSYLVYRALQRIFSRAGMKTIFAQKGGDAIPMALENKIDAIVLDINLQDVDGLDICKQIRKNPITMGIPVIIITANSEPECHVAALDAGADDFVPKPPSQKVLLRRLANLIAQRRAANENQRLMGELERYISQAAIEQAQHNRGVETIEATILFSDMRGFTAASFDHDIADVFNAINQAMSFQAQVIKANGGYIDGFSGDGLLAVFSGIDAEFMACKTAIEIIQLARTTKVEIWDPLPIGIGIHSGHVMRGDLGSNVRRTHTVIGSTVNVSARLCGVANRTQAIASERVMKKVMNKLTFLQPEQVQLKGLPTPMLAYPIWVP